MSAITALAHELAAMIAALPTDDARLEALNEARKELHAVSPLRHHPIDLVLWVPAEAVEANDYNPNTVAPAERKLLEHSIESDGYTQPVVTWVEQERRETVDGFHRGEAGRTSATVREQTLGYLPVTTANADRTGRNDRMASTIRHNRARGRHRVDGMSAIVQELVRRNWSEERIAKELGMDADEVLRLKQITGLAELFAEREFSQAWEPAE
jgi:hypothetical protein